MAPFVYIILIYSYFTAYSPENRQDRAFTSAYERLDKLRVKAKNNLIICCPEGTTFKGKQWYEIIVTDGDKPGIEPYTKSEDLLKTLAGKFAAKIESAGGEQASTR